MLRFTSFFNFISIPDNIQELTIYQTDYFKTKDGKFHKTMPHGDCYSYGDVIIETPTTRYVFKQVYAAYEIVARISQSIHEQKIQSIIEIDLDKISGDETGFTAEGGFEIIHIAGESVSSSDRLDAMQENEDDELLPF